MNPENSPRNRKSQKQLPPVGWTVVIVVLAVVTLFGFMLRSNNGAASTIEDTSLFNIIQAIEAGRVKTITVQGDYVTANLFNETLLQARKETNISAVEAFQLMGASPETLKGVPIIIAEPNVGLENLFSFIILIVPFAFIGFILYRFSRQGQEGNPFNLSNRFGRSNPRVVTVRPDKKNRAELPSVTFDDVAGAEQAKLELLEVVEFLKEPDKFIKLGARIPKGVLMAGPPGTGKTLVAKAVAGEAGVPFFSISGSEFVEMFVGVGASRVRDLFKRAREQSPAVVFVDEIDAVGRRRGVGMGGGNDEREQTLNQILVEMDGFGTDVNVIIIAATNRPDVLDPALLRPGRFDRKVIMDRPDVNGREAILGIHTKGKPLSADVQIADLAKLTPGFVGADLENLVNEAAILAARRNQTQIGSAEFQDAMERIVAGPERKGKIISDQEREVVAYHEAGHAVVMHNLTNSDPVHKVSIISRGMALGYTMPLPENDKYLRTKEAFEDEIVGLLGGRAAEEIIFSQITTGAANDLERATKLAREMVTRYGFSEKLGLRTYGEDQGNVYLGNLGETRDYSEEIAQHIDGEMRHILDNAYQRAKSILLEQRRKLESLADTLLEVETVERPQFETMMS